MDNAVADSTAEVQVVEPEVVSVEPEVQVVSPEPEEEPKEEEPAVARNVVTVRGSVGGRPTVDKPPQGWVHYADIYELARQRGKAGLFFSATGSDCARRAPYDPELQNVFCGNRRWIHPGSRAIVLGTDKSRTLESIAAVQVTRRKGATTKPVTQVEKSEKPGLLEKLAAHGAKVVAATDGAAAGKVIPSKGPTARPAGGGVKLKSKNNFK